MTKQVQDAYIVAVQRTPVGRAPRGILRMTRPEDLIIHAIKGTLEKCPNLDPALIEDFILGCAMPEAEQGLNMARIVALLAGLPDTVPGVTVNRFCASGLQSVAWAADRIRLGESDVILAGGVESMSQVPMGGNNPALHPDVVKDENFGIAYGMGMTAERVADQWGITREAQDEFAVNSHAKALKAAENGWWSDEILPFTIHNRQPSADGRTVEDKTTEMTLDEGPRPGTSMEGLAKLRAVFATKGSVTAGNSSQTSDGAAAVVVMSERKMKQLGLEPIARFVGYAVAGVPAEIMGIGPAKAVPLVMQQTGLRIEDMDWIELNEAFAAQGLAVIKDLHMEGQLAAGIINPNGGAIALGHPLGGTGSIRVATTLHGLRRKKREGQNAKYGLVTMCIGTGMGAAGIFEMQ